MGDKLKYKKIYSVSDPSTSSGGGAAPIDITWSDLETLYLAGTMEPGFYNITDRADGSIVLEATSATQLSLHGSALFLVPDFQSVGDYSGVATESGIAYTTTKGVWSEGKQYLTITYDTLAGGTFSIGDPVIDSITGAMGTVVTDDGMGSMTFFINNNIAYSVGNQINNDGGVTANILTISSQDSIFIGDIVFWNGIHYQCVNMDSIGASNPSLSPSYYQLSKSYVNVGYIQETDYIEYDFINDTILLRHDKRKNSVYYYSGGSSFQWGNNSVSNNTVGQEVDIECINQLGIINANIFEGIETYPIFGNDFTGSVYGCYFRGLNDGLGRSIRFFDTTDMVGCSMTVVAHTSISGGQSFSYQTMNAVTSNFAITIDITGATTLDITANKNYAGIVILTSSNATESIDTISNFPLIQPVRFFVDSGLVVTFVHGTGGGNPQCAGGVDAIIDGNTGDFIEFTKLYGKIKQTGGETY